jgi:hypothetical protein
MRLLSAIKEGGLWPLAALAGALVVAAMFAAAAGVSPLPF